MNRYMLGLVAVTLVQSPTTPSARLNHASCYSAPMRSTLMFGGRGAGRSVATDSTLWNWDGSRWTAMPSAGPSPRSSPVVVCDPRRSRLVMYGGYLATSFADTWEWDGTRWNRKDLGGLPTRAHAAAAFDPVRGTVILFGGFADNGNAALGDTWEWDGIRWTRLEASGPEGRYGHSLVADPVNGRILMSGGASGFGSAYAKRGDVWEWKGGAWRQLPGTAPNVSTSEPLVIGANGVPTIVGTAPNASHVSVWKLQADKWALVDSTGPPARDGHSTAYDPARNSIVMFGGVQRGTAIAELWERTVSGWSKR